MALVDSGDDFTWGAPSGRIDGWQDFADRLRAAVAMGTVETADWRWSDLDFSRWPLGDRGVVEALQQGVLAHAHTRCTLLAATFDEVPRQHPRWLAWRRPWAHRVRCAQAMTEDVSRLRPMLLWPGRLGLCLLDSALGVGVWSTDAATLHGWQNDFDVILQRSTEALPSTTLGL
jgi:hypothetical protein